MMWHGWGPGDWGGWLLMTPMMLVFWGGLVAVAIWAFRSLDRQAGPDRPAGSSVDAMAILEERFAQGAIDQEEFERRRGVLRGKGAAQGR